MGWFVLLAVKLLFWALVLTCRFTGRTAVFAWRRPWAFMALAAALPVLLALPEYIS